MAMLSVQIETGTSFAQTCGIAKLTASNGQTGDRFGYSLDIEGLTLVVGMTFGGGGPDDQFAWVFEQDPSSGQWLESAILALQGNQPGSGFGQTVAISGDFAVVGASNAGAAYVFWRDEGGINNWGLLSTLPAPDPDCGCAFARMVSIDGDTAIVNSGGTAYIFQQNQGGPNHWGLVTTLTVPPFTTAMLEVAISGDTAIVKPAGGFAFVFERDEGGPNSWGNVGCAEGPTSASSLALHEDTLVYGNWQDNTAGTQAGAAYVFQRDQGGPNNWGQVVTLTAPVPTELDQFGYSVDIDGDSIAVGARGLQPGRPSLGSVHVFGRNAGGENNWGHLVQLSGSDTEPDDGIGQSVSVSGTNLVLGALYDTNENGGIAGSAYVFGLDGPDCNGNGICDSVEIAKATSADVNANGIPDDCDCLPDINGSGEVNVIDLLRVLVCFGLPASPDCVDEDVNFDGTVNVLDLIDLLLAFGTACP